MKAPSVTPTAQAVPIAPPVGTVPALRRNPTNEQQSQSIRHPANLRLALSDQHALLAQLVEHFHGKEGVSGSSPEEGLGFKRVLGDQPLVANISGERVANI